MKSIHLTFYSLLLSCLMMKVQYAQETIGNGIYHLDQSTHIMNMLIKSDGLSQILLPDELQYADFYIDNYSPAQLAYSAEVLACANPVLIICGNDQELHAMEAGCNRIAHQYPGLKIVTVNDETLPSIIAMLDVSTLPALLLIDQAKELGRVEGLNNLEADFEALLCGLGV